MTLQDWQMVSAIGSTIGGGVALLTALIWIFRAVVPTVRELRSFSRHAMGIPADPRTGQLAVPSIFQRLGHLEEALAHGTTAYEDIKNHLSRQDESLVGQDKALERIEHEVFPNSGGSLRDAADTAVKKVGELAERLDQRVTELAERLDQLAPQENPPKEQKK